MEDVEEGADPEASSSGSVTPGYLGTPFKRGRGRPPKVSATQNQMQNFLANLGLPGGWILIGSSNKHAPHLTGCAES